MSRIFVIEGDNILRNNIAELLRSENYYTLEAVSALEAKSKIKQYTPDLIISEAMMPEMDGIEFLKYLRSSTELCNIPFIFLTGRPDYLDHRSAMNAGADDYFTKPFKSIELLEAVKVLLKKKRNLINEMTNLKRHIVFKMQHELRTPLVPILGYSDIISENIDNLSKGEIKNFVNSINSSGKKLHKIIEKLILYFNIKTLTSESNRKYSDKGFLIYNKNIQNIISELYKTNCPKMIKTNVTFSQLQIDPFYFSVIMKELVENAVNYSMEEYPIVISGSIFENKYHLSVKNHVNDCINLHRDAEYSLTSADKKYLPKDDAGIGLMIIKTLVEYFDGEFHINNFPEGQITSDVFLKLSPAFLNRKN